MHINLIKSSISFYSENDVFNHTYNIIFDNKHNFEFNIIDGVDIIDKTQKYLLLYPLQGHVSHKIKQNIELISDTILQKIKQGYNIKIFFCVEAECEHENANLLLHDYLVENGISTNNVYLISGNSKIESIENYGIHTIENFNPIIHRVSNTMEMHSAELEWVLDKKYIFQCYNNFMKSHRTALLCLLEKENILDSIDWSALRTYDLFNLPEDGIHEMYNIFEPEEILSLSDFYYKVINNGESKYSEYEDESIRNADADGEPDHNLTYVDNPHKNAYINIVNESQFVLKNTIHITEKSLVPFNFHQLPLFVATQGHVSKLKKLYGFDVFDDFIDHSYDEIESPKERLYAIINEIKRLNGNSSNLIDFYKNNKHRFESNKEIVNKLAEVHPYTVIFEEFINS